jgi:UDP-4-amino-4,6-dideoxy-N-acetyl-beta-L-altrosamine transaminase
VLKNCEFGSRPMQRRSGRYKPMYIPYGRQSISQDDIDAVVDVLKSDFLTQGPAVPAFEAAVLAHCGAAYAVAVNSATSALHIACLALGVGTGDIVWTSPITFVASANCARYCGAEIDFVDIDPVTFNMSPARLEEKLIKAAAAGTLPKVVIPVHMTGQPCDMAAIAELAKIYGFQVIEDASHAIGARCRESITGDCRYSDVTVFSFHPVKIVTTAEGGMATTNDPELARKMEMLRSHGITRDASRWRRKNEGAWYYEQQSLGLNYRLTDMQAALGTRQLTRLTEWIERRHRIADRYDCELAALPLVLPVRQDRAFSALHLYVVQIAPARTPVSRKQFFDGLRAGGIGVNVHYIPVHLQPDFMDLGFCEGNFPRSEHYYANCVSLPMFATLSDDQLDAVIGQVRALLQ